MFMHEVIERNPADGEPDPFLNLSATIFEDPLDEDVPGDAVVTASRRGLVRLALVAAETGARFARQGVQHDPMAWMLAPRRMFHGRAAVEACLERDACVRALLLHGLDMGLDADPDEMDELAADDLDDAAHEDAGFGADAFVDGAIVTAMFGRPAPSKGPALYTSTAVGETTDGHVHVLQAVVAGSREEARSIFRRRHGDAIADDAQTLEGFRPHLPLAAALVSPALADMLAQVAQAPASALGRGLDLSIEQRFAS